MCAHSAKFAFWSSPFAFLTALLPDLNRIVFTFVLSRNYTYSTLRRYYLDESSSRLLVQFRNPQICSISHHFLPKLGFHLVFLLSAFGSINARHTCRGSWERRTPAIWEVVFQIVKMCVRCSVSVLFLFCMLLLTSTVFSVPHVIQQYIRFGRSGAGICARCFVE